VLLLTATFAIRSQSAAAVDCVGKPYGYPGCPTRPAPSSLSASSGPNSCGNAILDPGEECDKGRFNDKTDCSMDCKFLYCGDGKVTKDIGEECEPETEEVYVEDKNGNLTTEIRFVGDAQSGGTASRRCATVPAIARVDASRSTSASARERERPPPGSRPRRRARAPSRP
jgi:hypothetical protein